MRSLRRNQVLCCYAEEVIRTFQSNHSPAWARHLVHHGALASQKPGSESWLLELWDGWSGPGPSCKNMECEKAKQNKKFNQNLSGNEADFCFCPRWLPLERFFSDYEVIFSQSLPVPLLGWRPQLGSQHVGLMPSSLGVVCIEKSGACYESRTVPGTHTVDFLSCASTIFPHKLFRDQFNGPPVQCNWALNWAWVGECHDCTHQCIHTGYFHFLRFLPQRLGVTYWWR